MIKDADVFIGVSEADILTQDMVKTMADDPIIFAMANPNPEINPNEAKQAVQRLWVQVDLIFQTKLIMY